MRCAQIKSGQKLHLVYEAGEGEDPRNLVPAGRVSAPLCHTHHFKGKYRMTINLPLAHACKNCYRIYDSRRRKALASAQEKLDKLEAELEAWKEAGKANSIELMKICLVCRYSTPFKGLDGFNGVKPGDLFACRRRAANRADLSGGFPLVRPDDWCGEFEPRIGEVKP